MFREIIAALVAGTVFTGLSATADAKPRVQSQGEGGYTTRSGASLRGLENRSVSEDFPTTFSSQPSRVAVPAPILLRDRSEVVPQPQAITVFGQKIELGDQNSSSNSPNQAPSHVGVRNVEVSTGASSTDGEQLFRVQYRLLSQPEEKSLKSDR